MAPAGRFMTRSQAPRRANHQMNLQSLIRTIPDYPKPGIQFRDITTLLRDARRLSRRRSTAIAERYRGRADRPRRRDRGARLHLRTAVAYELGAGFVPLRKPGKLPGETIGGTTSSSTAATGSRCTRTPSRPGERVLLVDDLIATGGTAEAAIALDSRSRRRDRRLRLRRRPARSRRDRRLERARHTVRCRSCEFEGE